MHAIQVETRVCTHSYLLLFDYSAVGTQIGKWQHRLNINELIIVLCISVITYPQHINYTETAGLSVVGRFMVLVLFYMQLRQPTPQRFPPGVIYMVFMSNN